MAYCSSKCLQSFWVNARNSPTSNVRSVYGFVTSSLLAVQSCINLASISPLYWNGIKWQHQTVSQIFKVPHTRNILEQQKFSCWGWLFSLIFAVFHKPHQFKLAVLHKIKRQNAVSWIYTPLPPQDASQKPRITTFFSRESKQLICNSQLGPGVSDSIPSTKPWKKHLGGFGSFGQIGSVHWWRDFFRRSFYICDVRMFFDVIWNLLKICFRGTKPIEPGMLHGSYMKATSRKITWVKVCKKNMFAYLHTWVIRTFCKSSIILHFECISSLLFPEVQALGGQEWVV